jgi:hypothetical protein
MGGLMNFGCFLAEEERSEIDFSGGMAMRPGSSVLSSSDWSSATVAASQNVRLAVPYYILGERITFN